MEAGIHSRRRAANELGVEDPETEFALWLAEEGERGAGRLAQPPPPGVPGARGEGRGCPYVQLSPMIPLHISTSPTTRR